VKLDENFDWNNYYKSKSNLVPRDSLLKALEFFDNEKIHREHIANDIGCGHGADTLELLKRGWKVTAIDSSAQGLEILSASVEPDWKNNLSTKLMSLEDITLSKCTLLNASYSLPFCKPEFFDGLWKKIEESILTSGRFAGQFFGVNDSWAKDNPAMTFLEEENVRRFFQNFEIEFFHERDEDGTTATGDEKHWHVYSVIAKKV